MTARPNTQAAHARAWTLDARSAYGAEAVAGIYVGSVLFAPWLGSAVLAAAAVVTGVLVAWNTRARWRSQLALASWAPAHLLLMASGGPAGPALPLVAAWAALLAFTQTTRIAAAGAALATVLVGVAALWVGHLSPGGGVETVLAVGSGVVLGAVARQLTGSMEGKAHRLERILDDAHAGQNDVLSAAVRRSEELSEALEEARARFGAERAVLWDVIEGGERARPRIVAGDTAPPTIALNGDPLRWVWEETLPLRLDVPPTWAIPDTRAAAVSVLGGSERYSLLTVEWRPDEGEVSLESLQDAARYLRAMAHLQVREAAADAARNRFEEMLAFVRQLPGEMAPETFPTALAETAQAVAGATGALVAHVEEESGRVVANVGEDGGPVVGTYFSAMESDCGWAVRTRSAIRRWRRSGTHGQRPVVANGERWAAEPRAVVALPLLDPKSQIRGVLAVWTTEADDLDADAMGLLEVFAPVFALQLQHASDLAVLQERATVDALTGLHNRGTFDERMEEEQQRFLRYRHPAALIVLDIDHFKAINDTFGHEAGDAVLRMIGAVIDEAVREVDFAGRYGGEEFVLLLPDTMRAAAVDVAERLRAAIDARPVLWNGERIRVQASFGVSACPECVDTPAQLVQSADRMLYASKEGGRNRVTAAPVGREEEGGQDGKGKGEGNGQGEGGGA